MPLGFLRSLSGCENILVDHDKQFITRLTTNREVDIVYLNKALSAGDKLTLRVTENNTGCLRDQSFIFGLTTCNLRGANIDECHSKTECSSSSACDGGSLSVDIRNCNAVDDSVSVEWTGRNILVSGKVNFQWYDRDRIFGRNKPAFPYIILSGNVSGIGIEDGTYSEASGEEQELSLPVLDRSQWPALRGCLSPWKPLTADAGKGDVLITGAKAAVSPVLSQETAVPAAEASSSVGEKINFLCVICQEKTKNQMVSPCNHIVYCGECKVSAHSSGLRNCPMCRSKIKRYIRVFH